LRHCKIVIPILIGIIRLKRGEKCKNLKI
jgi:hypothetical protein